MICKEDIKMTEKVYMKPNPALPCRPIEINTNTCTGCDLCLDICLHDVFMPNPVRTMAPIVLYPEECWYCGSCVEECPIEGTIVMNLPLKQKLSVRWKRKETGEIFRLGMNAPPPPNTKPPSGDAYKVKKQPKPRRVRAKAGL